MSVITAQTGGRQFDGKNLTKYSLFVGGFNATHHALKNYSPLLNGFGRLFMVRPPHAIARMFAESDGELYSSNSLFMQFKHMLEYMNTKVTGFGDKSLGTAEMMGGFVGRKINTPTVTKDSTESITIGLYEFVGSPVYTVIDGWMNAIGDENSGLATYGGFISGGKAANGTDEVRLYARSGDDSDAIAFNESQHTCEFIYVVHDRSGAQVERAVMLADCYPTGIAQSGVLDYTAGSHENVTYDITFNCIVYRSTLITKIADMLLKEYMIVSNSLNMNPQLGDAVFSSGTTSTFSDALGEVPSDSATGTKVGNLPVYYVNNTPTTITSDLKNIEPALLSGQPGYEA